MKTDIVYTPRIPKARVFTFPSKTVPDSSYTVSEILKQFTSGIAPNVQRSGEVGSPDVTFDDLMPEDTRFFDSADAFALKQSMRSVDEIKSDLVRIKAEEKAKSSIKADSVADDSKKEDLNESKTSQTKES